MPRICYTTILYLLEYDNKMYVGGTPGVSPRLIPPHSDVRTCTLLILGCDSTCM